MKDILIGRKPEIALLEKIKNIEKSAFVAVYGRRRVGKTFLIRKTLGDQFTFQVTGRANANLKLQLVNFHAAIVKYFPIAEKKPMPKTWFASGEKQFSARAGIRFASAVRVNLHGRQRD